MLEAVAKELGRVGRVGDGGDDDGDGDDADDGSVEEVVLEEDDDEDDESLDGEVDPQKRTGASGGVDTQPVNNTRALLAKAAEIEMRHEGMPWAETFAVVPLSPPVSGSPLEVHDDLKREVAFYSAAMEAVTDARGRCREAGVKFAPSRRFLCGDGQIRWYVLQGESTCGVKACLFLMP